MASQFKKTLEQHVKRVQLEMYTIGLHECQNVHANLGIRSSDRALPPLATESATLLFTTSAIVYVSSYAILTNDSRTNVDHKVALGSAPLFYIISEEK